MTGTPIMISAWMLGCVALALAARSLPDGLPRHLGGVLTIAAAVFGLAVIAASGAMS